MTDMRRAAHHFTPPAINREIAFAGRRVQQKVTLGLVLTLIIPLLVLAYGLFTYVLPLTGSAGGADLQPLMMLITFTGLLMVGGSIVVWDVATAVSRAARLISSSRRIDPEQLPDRHDDIGALLSSFARMTATIEQQAEELRRVPARLDELARQAFRDSLTGLANRALFMDRLGHALVRTERRADHVAGRRVVRSFKAAAEAWAEAERIVRDPVRGSETGALSGKQARDALPALERLDELHRAPGERFSLLGAVSEFAEAKRKLGSRPQAEAGRATCKASSSCAPKSGIPSPVFAPSSRPNPHSSPPRVLARLEPVLDLIWRFPLS